MPPDQFLGDGLDYVAEFKRALLLGHPGVEDDLEQEIAKLIAELIEVVVLDRIGDLVGFLERIWRDGPKGLFEVPGAAAAGGAEGGHDLDQSTDVSGGFHATTLTRSRCRAAVVIAAVHDFG
jgi:hypothetical protein